MNVSPQSTTATHHHIPALDGIRGLAILIVFAGHVALFGPAGAEGQGVIVLFLAKHAGTGVDLFFVLSGFLITGILYDSKGSQFYFRRFFSRRVLRIFPLYYSVLAVVAIGTLLFPNLFALKTITRAAHVANWTYTSNILMSIRGWGAEPLFLGHFWSLAVEEQFYLLWPFFVLFLSHAKLIRVCAIGIVVALLFRIFALTAINYESMYVLLPSRMDALMIGAVIALLARRPSGMPAWVSSPLSLAAAFAAYLGWLFFAKAGNIVTPVFFSLEPLAFGALLASLVYGERLLFLKAIFASRFLRFFGKYSYAIYVFHLAIIVALPKLIEVVTSRTSIAYAPDTISFGIIAMLLTIACALVSWNVLEKRALALKDRLVFRRSSLANDHSPSYVS